MTTLPAPGANPMRRYLHGKGTAPYALITGATGEGMGREWAFQLAALGFNIIIQGRNAKKLEDVKQTILSRQIVVGKRGKKGGSTPSKRRRTTSDGNASAAEEATKANGATRRKNSVKKRKSSSSLVTPDNETESEGDVGSSSTSATALPVPAHVQVEMLVCEATPWPNKGLNEGLDALLQRKEIRLTVVINNLGVQSEGYPRLDDLERDELAGIVVANSLFPAEVTRRTLPHLKKHQPSLLITVTSIGAWTPTPYLSPYMGTKGFDVAFSHSLRSEMQCEAEQVDVVCMVPGQVQSGMCAEPVSLMVPTSFDWVRAAIVSLRPGGLLGAFLPYAWLAPPPITSSAKARANVASSFWTRPRGVITPWWPHYMGMVVAQYGPSWLVDSVAVSTVKDLKRKHEETSK